MTATVDTRPHALYRFFDRHGVLLYVGLTMDPGSRWKAHSKGKAWWLDVHDIRIEHFSDRASVEAAERQAIRTEKPLHNIQHAKHNTPPRRSTWHDHVVRKSVKVLKPELDQDFVEIPDQTPCSRYTFHFRADQRTFPFTRKLVIDRDDAVHVQLDRDAYLEMEFEDYLPGGILSAAKRCADHGLAWIRGEGHWTQRAVFLNACDRWVSLFVPHQFLNQAADALIRAELDRDVVPLMRLGNALEDGLVR